MAEAGFTGDGFTALANRFRELAANLKPLLIESSAQVETAMRTKVNELYGQKLGKHWTIECANSDALAAVTVWTDDVRVRGYEFGTPRHRIPQAGNARPVLHFDWKQGQAFFPYVEHPGTPPHDKRFELKDALNQEAQSVWSQSIRAAFQTL